jgi:hypothetical protein
MSRQHVSLQNMLVLELGAADVALKHRPFPALHFYVSEKIRPSSVFASTSQTRVQAAIYKRKHILPRWSAPDRYSRLCSSTTVTLLLFCLLLKIQRRKIKMNSTNSILFTKSVCHLFHAVHL